MEAMEAMEAVETIIMVYSFRIRKFSKVSSIANAYTNRFLHQTLWRVMTSGDGAATAADFGPRGSLPLIPAST
eukprot:CAMPEP_0197845552 /NCGR_PEP_ID=MMETSP1438-20131217/2472_1 /TAXON_ID=1461541 /ORGANISM="Pterosperma sp., Strain CCMP1384" /LENGTH=72 /DNA_ID=CAMNT_0043456891 /DNA_START=68 /DNA_END=283 /DNA_ORIENTATION=+